MDYLTELSEWAIRERNKMLDSDVQKALEAGFSHKELGFISRQGELALAIHHESPVQIIQIGPFRKIKVDNYRIVVS